MSISPNYAYENAQRYWATAEKTHREVGDSRFNQFYERIAEIVQPRISEKILDAGCGSGEITNAFHKNGFKILGFDSSRKLIDKARKIFKSEMFYVDDFLEMENKEDKYSKIFVNGAFFYVHPRRYQQVLQNFYDILVKGGKLYLLDNPDFEKKGTLYKDKVRNIFTTIFPVYDANNSGFWVKEKDVAREALKIGYSSVEDLDSWTRYRSHMVLEK